MAIESVLRSNHLTSVGLFSFCLQFFSASGSFPMSQFFLSCGQSIGASASASVLPMNIQDWFPLGLTGWISLQSKGLSRVVSIPLGHPSVPPPSILYRVCSDSCPLSQWCYLNISSSIIPFFFFLQSFPASGTFPKSWLFASSGQSIWTSVLASILPMSIQAWFPLELTDLISLLSKGLSRVFSSTTIQKHLFFCP